MIVVTGANGQLGRLVVDALLKVVNKEQVIALVRNMAHAQDLQQQGVQVRQADYSQLGTLAAAFQGAEKVLLISSNEIGKRVAQHAAVVEAARAAGATLLAYTSILKADTSTLQLAVEHKQTERDIQASGLPYVFLRNGWYTENQTGSLGAALEHGAVLGAAKDGRFAAASRADYAAAAVAVLTQAGHANQIYELGGDAPYTLEEFAAEVSAQAGKLVAYHDLPEAEYAKVLMGFGLPEPVARGVANGDAGASRGELTTDAHDLSRLIGRPTVSLQQAIATALAGLNH